MESVKPKPQRPRRQKKQQQKKVEVDVKVKNASEKRKNPRRGVISSTTGMQVGYLVSTEKQDQKKLRTLERQLKKLKMDQKGPKTQDVMTTTLTLGPILGSQLDGLNRSMRCWMNPTQLKPTDGLDTVTPLSLRASQYDLFKILAMHVQLQPLVGSSVVTGSMVFVDLDQEASAVKPENVDTVKARPHVELTIGSRRFWKIPRKFLEGPRAGWWYVDTNEDPSQSLGPALNMWTYMKTKNIFMDKSTSTSAEDYTGPLFLAELRVTYAFANYNPKPGLAQMVTAHDYHDASGAHKQLEAKLMNDEENNVVLAIKQGQPLAQVLSSNSAMQKAATGSTKEEKSATIWSIAGTTVSAIASALGPWGWLLKGGWWLIRKIFKAPSALAALPEGYDYYMVYASVEDARADIPINQLVTNYETSSAGPAALPDGHYHVKQLNEPNLNRMSSLNVQQVQSRITPPPEPEPQPQKETWWLPLCRETYLPKPVPPIYTWSRPAPGAGDVGLYIEGAEGQGWNSNIVIMGSPVVTRFTLKKDQDGQPYYTSVEFAVQNQTGSISQNFKMPNTTSWLSDVTDQWFWLDLLDTGVLFSAGRDDLRYSTQGVIHTARTFLRACRDHQSTEFKELYGWSSTIRKLLTEGSSTYEGWRVDWLNVIANNMSTDLLSDTLVVLPLAIFCDPKKVGILLADHQQELFSIVLPNMTWPNAPIQESAAIKWGIDTPFLATSLWNESLYIQERKDGRIAFRKGPQVEKELRIKYWQVDEDSDDSGIELVTAETFKKMQELFRRTEKEGKL
nr:capsid protein [Crow astrovirus]